MDKSALSRIPICVVFEKSYNEKRSKNVSFFAIAIVWLSDQFDVYLLSYQHFDKYNRIYRFNDYMGTIQFWYMRL